MSDKTELNLIKKEHCSEDVPGGFMVLRLTDANRIIQEWYDKFKTGYVVSYDGFDDDGLPWSGINTFKTDKDTHRITYKTEPLEEKKPECDHRLYVPMNLIDVDKYQEFRKQFKNCHKCGEKL